VRREPCGFTFHANIAEHDNGGYQVYDYPGIYLETGAGNAVAKRRLQELQSTRRRAEGRANARGMLAGALLTLEQHPLAARIGSTWCCR
jgi:type VI secretion system secreted protein VgrG